MCADTQACCTLADVACWFRPLGVFTQAKLDGAASILSYYTYALVSRGRPAAIVVK